MGLPYIYISITIISIVMIPISHIILLHIFNKILPEWLLIILLICIPNLIFIYILDDYIIAESINIISIVLLYLSIFLIYFELYVFLKRGFALSILISINDEKSINITDLINKYGNGKGFDWLISKRIKSLIQYKLIEINEYNEIYVMKKMLIIYHILNMFK